MWNGLRLLHSNDVRGESTEPLQLVWHHGNGWISMKKNVIFSHKAQRLEPRSFSCRLKTSFRFSSCSRSLRTEPQQFWGGQEEQTPAANESFLCRGCPEGEPLMRNEFRQVHLITQTQCFTDPRVGAQSALLPVPEGPRCLLGSQVNSSTLL